MSYCRKGHDSDLYIIGTYDGFECLVCPLQMGEFESWYGETPKKLYHHMLAHVSRGHRVPLEAIERAQTEMYQAEGYVELLYRLSAPRTVFDFYARTGYIIEMLDSMDDDEQDLTIGPDGLLNHPAWQWWDDDD